MLFRFNFCPVLVLVLMTSQFSSSNLVCIQLKALELELIFVGIALEIRENVKTVARDFGHDRAISAVCIIERQKLSKMNFTVFRENCALK